MPTEGDLRVWNYYSSWGLSGDIDYTSVGSIEDGLKAIKELAEEQKYDSNIITNAFGLEIFTDGDWEEWYDDEGNDIMDLYENEE